MNSDIRRLLPTLVDPYTVHRILEIGCFEGVGSAFFSDVFLEHNSSMLTCVDPFLPGDVTTPQVVEATKTAFYENINNSDQRDKIRVFEGTSDEFFKINEDDYTIIYIDGDHRYETVKRDLDNAAGVLTVGGILWCDDYAWSPDIQRAVREFLEERAGQFTVFHEAAQIAFQKQY